MFLDKLAQTFRALTENKKTMSWFWLSFADPHKPRGQQFLGVALVEVFPDDPIPLEPPDPEDRPFVAAIAKAHRMGLNPGGEVAGFAIAAPPLEQFQHRLLNADEAKAVKLEKE